MMMKPFDEDDLTALKLSSMNVSNRNAEMPSNRKQRDAVNYKETNLITYAKEAYYWSEEELNSLWIGARMHGQSAWEAMLNDSRLRFSNFRTPTSLAERWILERQKIESENIQAPWTSNREKPLAVQTIDEAEISCGFMNIHKKADSSSSRRPAAVSQPSKKRVAVIGHAKFRKRASIKTSQDQDNITGMGNIIDPSKIDFELSLNEWVKGKDSVLTIDEAEISSGLMKIHKKADSSSSSSPAAVSQPSKKRVAVIGHAKSRKLASIKTSQDQDNIIDPSKIDCELSLDEWVKGKDSVLTIDEAEISSGFMKGHKKAGSSSSSLPAAVSQPSMKRVAVIGHAKSRKLASIKTSQDQDNITGMGNSIDPSKIDFELSLDEWVKGNDSEGTVSG